MLHSKETEWDVTNAETQHHYDMILTQMKLAAEKLPRSGPLCWPREPQEGGRGLRGEVAASPDEEWRLCMLYTFRVSAASSYLACALIQEMPWQRSANEIRLFGPAKIART